MTTLKELNELKELLNSTVKEVYKSPLSESFYSMKVSSGYKPEKVIRVSDHWNFQMNDDLIHCQTHQEVEDNTHLSVGIMENGKFNILISLKKNKNILFISDVKHTLYYDYEKCTFLITDGRVKSSVKIFPIMSI